MNKQNYPYRFENQMFWLSWHKDNVHGIIIMLYFYNEFYFYEVNYGKEKEDDSDTA